MADHQDYALQKGDISAFPLPSLLPSSPLYGNTKASKIAAGKSRTYPLLGMVCSQVSIREFPELAVLLHEGETLADLLKLSPENILIRWAYAPHSEP